MPTPLPCPERCNVLLIGGGGREHALAWKLAQSPRLGALWLSDAANAALSRLGRPCPVKMDMSNVFLMRRWCEQQEIHLVVVGPEGPLDRGIADVLISDRRAVFGPNQRAAQLEADKSFAKEIMRQSSVPTADARVFTSAESARTWLEAHDEPCVVKASGLAAGKGAVVCDTPPKALDAVSRMLEQHEFGEAGDKILIEEKLEGQEVSILALVDGRTIWTLDPCQDHKQRDEGDRGPNTGGMGAYCPAPVVDRETMRAIEQEILVPTVDALRRDGIDYRGVLYAGIMLTPGGPKVLEFNCRFGDPECQPLMPRLKGDLIEILWATCTGTLDRLPDIEFDDRTAVCVVMASGGYPGAYDKGLPITGIEAAESLGGPGEEVVVFHAGTRMAGDQLVTNGGRVLGVTALASDLRTARDLANAACDQIRFEGAFFRRDIGDRLLKQPAAPTPAIA